MQGFNKAPIYGLKLKDCTFENVAEGIVVANVNDSALQNVRVNGKLIGRLSGSE